MTLQALQRYSPSLQEQDRRAARGTGGVLRFATEVKCEGRRTVLRVGQFLSFPNGRGSVTDAGRCTQGICRAHLEVGRKDRVERTCNAQASDDLNWLEIQVLELRLQAVPPEGARFALHVYSPGARA
jgi:hypothetical protein